MKVAIVIVVFLVCPLLAAQERGEAENPLAALKDEVKGVLEEADLPFTTDQERQIVLMMEDRRQASEDLFGDLLDFRAGPTQGQEADRLRSAIEWMRSEFLIRLRDYLTPEQLEVWNRVEASRGSAPIEPGAVVTAAAVRPQNQTQYVRINNNSFTSEDGSYRFGRGGGGRGNAAPEVIQRGGVGAYHGNAELLFKDESLNAGRRFASNKPPYQERQASFNISGPLIPGRLTTNLSFSRNEAKNVDTIRATLPEGVFALGITKPATNRNISTGNTLQLTDAHSLTFNASYRDNSSENQGVGGFTLPERASTSSGNNWNIEVRQFSSLSPRSIFETNFNYTSAHSETDPVTDGVRINVPDAFSSGGAQNRAADDDRTYNFGNLYTRLGETLTIKTGFNGVHRKAKSFSESNFTGTFTFSSLENFIEGRPAQFRINQGEPLLEASQSEFAFFFQNDYKVTPRFTFMYGVRYEVQTNIGDHNNLDPRIGFAYGIGRATVIRGGGGIFHNRLSFDVVQGHRRFNGTQQYEIVIDNPSYPDPFESGSIRNTLRSIRVTDPDLTTPYNSVAMISVERTFLSNLFLSLQYDYNRGIHLLRNRNLNPPMDMTSSVPQSCSPGQSRDTCRRPIEDQGNIINMESTGKESTHYIRVNYRQRFSVFTASANYQMQMVWSDTPQNLFTNPLPVGFGAEALPSDNFNLRADWTRAAFPLHSINTTVNAQLPLGLFLTSTMSANSGSAYTILTGRDDNQDTSLNDRPPGVRRNSEPGPKVINFNFNISKAFFFGERGPNGNSQTNVNLFANMTNAFNRPNYARPSGFLTSPNFGKSTSAGDPREIEVGLRFQF